MYQRPMYYVPCEMISDEQTHKKLCSIQSMTDARANKKLCMRQSMY